MSILGMRDFRVHGAGIFVVAHVAHVVLSQVLRTRN